MYPTTSHRVLQQMENIQTYDRIHVDNLRYYKSIDNLYLGAKVAASLIFTSSSALNQEDIKTFKRIFLLKGQSR